MSGMGEVRFYAIGIAEMRGVFDRMLASDDAIKQAEHVVGAAPHHRGEDATA